MRLLMLFRGAPGCGKSTFIKDIGWEPYAISPDNIRMMMSSLQMQPDGKRGISQKSDQAVWDLVFDLLDKRFEKGLFTVLDSTNSKTEEMSRLKNFAAKYKYRVFLIDMTNIPMETVKQRNAVRWPPYKQVPDEVIDRQYARFKTQKIPNGITVIPFTTTSETRSAVYSKIMVYPLDLSKYKQIMHIGDVHGCATVLKEAIPEIDPDTFYIFCGDYLDRGLENVEVAKLLLKWVELPNILFLEGNHEKWLPLYGTGKPIPSKVFRTQTQPELSMAGIPANKLHVFYRKCAQMACYSFDNKLVLVSHGGLPIPYFDPYIPTQDYTHGVGKYEDIEQVIDSFNELSDGVYQVCGHRNVSDLQIQNGNFFLLEGHVENGGYLRTATLTHDGWQVKAFKNTVFREPGDGDDVVQIVKTKPLIDQLRTNPNIDEKKFGNISSFNFSRRAFSKGIWDKQTMTARGLFLDNQSGEIVARGYNKFFNLEERPETSVAALTNSLAYPVQVYKKENGFLGIASYDEEHDEILFCTKSNIGGEYAQLFERIFTDLRCDRYALKQIVMENKSVLFEVIDPANDPHIIKYPEPALYLLDIVENKLDGQFADYQDLQIFADLIGCKCKEKVTTLVDKNAFLNFVKVATQDKAKYIGKYIEGFVLEDASGYRVKIKTAYYNLWKRLRSLVPSVKKYGRLQKSGVCHNPIMIYFYDFLKKYYEVVPNGTTNIIELRDIFERDYMPEVNNGEG